MCFDHDAHPPVPAFEGAAFETDRMVLTASDGNEFNAYRARAGVPGGAGVVVMPDVRGLYPFYEELADRFAERGHDAIAVDYFGRTAGLEARSADWEFWPHVEQTTGAGVAADVAAAVNELRASGSTDIFTIGFCFGGSASWLQATAGHGLAGAIGFYGHPTKSWPEFEAPAQMVDRMECPILGLMGGADPSITTDDIAAFASALEAAGVEHQLHSYPGAPHSFFDRAHEEFADDSQDAWSRVLAFVDSRRS